MNIVLYRDDSASSEKAVSFLRKLGVDFEDIDVRRPAGFERLIRRTQQSTVPAFELKRARSIMVVARLDEKLLEREIKNDRKLQPRAGGISLPSKEKVVEWLARL
jgi:glutathione S-transferase